MSLLFLFSFVWLYEFVKTRTGSLKKILDMSFECLSRTGLALSIRKEQLVL